MDRPYSSMPPHAEIGLSDAPQQFPYEITLWPRLGDVSDAFNAID